jgi:cation:H+ antiporter
MNIASSNINQWTLLVAMLPVVLSFGRGEVTALQFDEQQGIELALTLSQSVLALMFLLNMRFAWWEAVSMFVLFAAQFVLPEFFGEQAKMWICYAFLAWSAAELILILLRGKKPEAVASFYAVWREHVRT